MSKKLDFYANQSAGNKEERIAKIFAALHTKDNYQPMSLPYKVEVSKSTILSYLKEIQKAQMLTKSYQKRLKEGFEARKYGQVKIESQKLFAKKHFDEWISQIPKVTQMNDEKKQALLQFTFDESNERLTLFYDRLEHSILVYSLIK